MVKKNRYQSPTVVSYRLVGESVKGDSTARFACEIIAIIGFGCLIAHVVAGLI